MSRFPVDESTSVKAAPPLAPVRVHVQNLDPALQRSPNIRSSRWSAVGQFLALTIQLALIAYIVQRFRIESRAFSRLIQISFAGFVVQYFLPERFRLGFFVSLSFATILMVVAPPTAGWDAFLHGFVQVAWLAGLGIGLIAICHLPFGYWWRLGFLAGSGAVLAFARVGWFPVPWSDAVWPILGSMFMFRLMVYMYDLEDKSTPRSPLHALAYFFMLPNVCFPLFPVVDYKTFCRSRNPATRQRTYQVGIHWILRGITQLLLYRFVYYDLTISETHVATLGDLVRYVITTFLMYLRISGQFHVIIGLMHLFGFALPESNHLYYLSSSFTDFWRRINIYWKDFMVKVFYYPAMFKLRKRGPTQALVLSTAYVFLVTWILHAYQSFWIHGSFNFSWNDSLFWLLLGSLVILTSLREAKRGRQRTLGAKSWTWRTYASLVFKTVSTFFLLCVIWSLWTADSLHSFWLLWQSAFFVTSDDLWLIPAGVIGMSLFAAATILAARHDAARSRGQRSLAGYMAMTTAWGIGLAILGSPAVAAWMGPEGEQILANLRSNQLNKHDVGKMDRGYYEKLLAVDRNSPLWNAYNQRPVEWVEFVDTGALRNTKTFQRVELTPNFTLNAYGKVFSTNAWGMRAGPVTLNKTSDSYRVAVLGDSYTMGFGVSNDETFIHHLAQEMNGIPAGPPFEVLNFAVYGYSPLQNLYTFENNAIRFAPDALLYTATIHDNTRPARHLALWLSEGGLLPWPELASLAEEAGVRPGMDADLAERRLLRMGNRLTRFVYERLVDRCRREGIVPLWAFFPRTQMRDETDPALVQLARDAGFVVMELNGVYGDYPLSKLIVAEWDGHPNAYGHQLLARRLLSELTRVDQQAQLHLFAPDRTARP